MFAKIKSTKSAKAPLLYNELKVKNGVAELLLARNYLKDADRLSQPDKLSRLKELNELNERVEKGTLHISLNFDLSEKLSNEQMKLLAKEYMKRIGFDRQPYLVYRHQDVAHPHLHIISSHVRANGNCIETRSFFFHSKYITRDMEKEFNLVRKERLIPPVQKQLKKLTYGQSGTKHSVNDILLAVTSQYKFTTLAELNAVLSLYNVKADRGGEDSMQYERKGLLYRVTDENGKNQGMPLKASSFYFKPTLSNLEKKFVINASLREEQRKRVTTMIDWTLAGRAADWERFKRDLEEEGISVVLQKDKKGEWQGIQYVDHLTKSVFDGAALGDKYQAQAIRQRCSQEQTLELKQSQVQRPKLRLRL
jgi:hypothetical protein